MSEIDRKHLSEEEAANCREIGCRLLQEKPYFHCIPSIEAAKRVGKLTIKFTLSFYRNQIPENCTRDYYEKYIK